MSNHISRQSSRCLSKPANPVTFKKNNANSKNSKQNVSRPNSADASKAENDHNKLTSSKPQSHTRSLSQGSFKGNNQKKISCYNSQNSPVIACNSLENIPMNDDFQKQVNKLSNTAQNRCKILTDSVENQANITNSVQNVVNVKIDQGQLKSYGLKDKSLQDQKDQHFFVYMTNMLSKKTILKKKQLEKEIAEIEGSLKRIQEKDRCLKTIIFFENYLKNLNSIEPDEENLKKIVSYINDLKVECTNNNFQFIQSVEDLLSELSKSCVDVMEYLNATKKLDENMQDIKGKFQQYCQLKNEWLKVMKETKLTLQKYILTQGDFNLE